MNHSYVFVLVLALLLLRHATRTRQYGALPSDYSASLRTSHARRAAIIEDAERRHEGYHSRTSFRRACSKTTIYARDNGICGICGGRVNWWDAERDHIVPLVRGGEHSPRNLQITHVWCNRQKGGGR